MCDFLTSSFSRARIGCLNMRYFFAKIRDIRNLHSLKNGMEIIRPYEGCARKVIIEFLVVNIYIYKETNILGL